MVKDKKLSKSLTVFKQALEQLKAVCPTFKILLFLHNSIERIVKVYCPVLSDPGEFVTIKDEFIRRTVSECDGISNVVCRLFSLGKNCIDC